MIVSMGFGIDGMGLGGGADYLVWLKSRATRNGVWVLVLALALSVSVSVSWWVWLGDSWDIPL